MYAELEDVVEDVCTVSVVVLVQHCHSIDEMSDPSASKLICARRPMMIFCRILWMNMPHLGSDAGMTLSENHLHIIPNLECWMALLSIP